MTNILRDKAFSQRILWHNQISQVKVTKFPYFPNKCSIQCTDLMIDVNLRGHKKWLAVNNFLKSRGVLNRAFTALSPWVKYIHYIWGKTFRRGKVTKYWLGDKNFHQRKLLPDEIFRDKVYLTFMKVLKRPPYQFFRCIFYKYRN